MAYSAKSQKTYNNKCYRFSIKFVPSEHDEVQRFKRYIEESGQSANAYIKELIRRDLDEKGIEYTIIDDRTDISAEKIPKEVATEDTEG